MYFDSHCHLDFEAFDGDRTAVKERACEAGVERLMVPGVEPKQWSRLRDLFSGTNTNFAYGIHPEWLTTLGESEIQSGLEQLADRLVGDGAHAVGECGMDGRIKDRVPFAKQALVFAAQLAAARETNRPAILHVLRAHGPALKVLKQVGPLERGGVVHSYSGSAELVRDYTALGYRISFAGSVTREGAERVAAAVRATPDEFLMAETDAPDQPFGGDFRNEPARVVAVVAALAKIRGQSLDHVADVTSRNAQQLFGC